MASSAILVALFSVICGLSTSAQSGYFWHVNDFHYDPTYHTTRASCADKNVTNPGKFGSYTCDSPWELLSSAIEALKREGPNPDFIIWNGDTGMHAKNDDIFDRPGGGNDLIIRLLQNVTDLITDNFPDTTVVPSLGNHDFYPKNQLPVEENKLYNETFEMWKHWIGDGAKETFIRGGFYKMTVSQNPYVVAIVPNSNLWSGGNRVTRDMEDPGDQFTWIDQQVNEIANNNGKVLIVTHMPPGSAVSSWWDREGTIKPSDGPFTYVAKFNIKFRDLMIKHKNTIITGMGCHHHNDYYHLFYDQSTGDVVNSFLVVPAISPYPWIAPRRNPAVRKFYQDSSFKLTDFDQYYLDLPADNQAGVANWKKEYQFTTAYGLQDLSHNSLEQLLRKMAGDIDEFDKFARFHRVSAEDKDCRGPCREQFLCSIEYIERNDWAKCMNEKYRDTTTEEPTTDSATKRTVPLELFLMCISLLLWNN